MAATDLPVILDNPDVKIGTGLTDISDFVSQIVLRVSHTRVTTPATAGENAPRSRASRVYNWQLTMTLETDGYEATEVDGLFTAEMPLPLGATDKEGLLAIEIYPDGDTIGVGNPKYSGTIVVDEWEPLGGDGNMGSRVSNTRTFMGSGPLTKATS